MIIYYFAGRYIALLRNPSEKGGFIGNGATRMEAMMRCFELAGLI